jgi:hypothetical protein
MAFLLALGTSAHAQISVSSGGQASTGLPIAVPPGISGMSPNLSLSYADGGVNGPVGVGWSVQGISTITRCPASRQADQAYRNVEFNKDDKLCLDGQRLIQTNADGDIVPSAINAVNGRLQQQDDALGLVSGFREFRTEKDSYSRIRAYGMAEPGDATRGPATFVVWTKSGLKYEYGRVQIQASGGAPFEPEQALIRVQGRTEVAVWAVRRISDVTGNFMEFRYSFRDLPWGTATGASPALGREWRLDQVRYTGKMDSNNLVTQWPSNVVQLGYVDRGSDAAPLHDRSEAYQWDRKNVSVWLLRTITTHVGVAVGANTGTLVKQYRLEYTRSPVSGRSLLNTVRECSSDRPLSEARCLPPTTYTYRTTSAPSFAAANIGSLRNEQLLDHTNGHAGIATGDFNGDGMTDVLRYHDDASKNRIFYSLGSGSFSAGTASNLGSVPLSHSNGCHSVQAMDINGDGFTDLLRITKPSCAGGNLLLLNQRNGSFQSVGLPASIRLERLESIETLRDSECVAPYRGTALDLRPLEAKRSRVPVDTFFGDSPLSAKPGAGPPPIASPTSFCSLTTRSEGHQFYFLDVDADGMLDIVTSKMPHLRWYSSWGPEPSTDTLCMEQGGCTQVFRQTAGGVFAPMATANEYDSLYRKPGFTSWNPNPYWQMPDVADINGDGLQDILADSGNWRSLGNGSFAMSAVQNASQLCSLPIDFNGDGRAGCLRPTATSTSLMLAFGATMVNVTNFNLTGPSDRLYGVNGSQAQTVGAVVEDFNGDGRQDILRFSETNSDNGIYLSQGDGTFSARSQAQLGNIRLQSSDGSRAFVLGDFLGDGTLQLLRLASNPPAGMLAPALTVNCWSSNCYEPPPPPPPSGIVDTPYNMLLVRTGTSGPSDVLETIRSASGLLSTVTSRRSLARGIDPDGAGYAPETGDPVSTGLSTAIINVTTPMYVITRTERETSPGVALQTRYRYEGLKVERGGRGMLGFRRMLQEDTTPAGTPMTVVTDYLQVYPYIGVASQTQSFLRALSGTGGSLLSTTRNTYCEWSVRASESSATYQAPCASSALIARPYLRQTVEQGNDLSGAVLPEVDTTNSYNKFGDPLSITVVTRGPLNGQPVEYRKVTTNTFCEPNATSCEGVTGASPNRTDGDRWILGRLSRSQVKSTAPNTLLPVSAGTAPNATATKGVPPPGTPMAINPAVLQTIINLILED